MKKKAIIILLIIIALLVFTFLFFKVYKDLRKESTIRNEIQEINRIIEQNNTDDEDIIYEILDRRTIEKGSYKKIENAIKNYYKDYYSSYKNIVFLLEEESIYNYLSNDNLKDFDNTYAKSKDHIINTNAQVEELYKTFTSYETEDKKNSYIAETKLDNYYKNFYIELTSNTLSETNVDEVKTNYTKYTTNLEIYNEALDFLNSKKNSWKIKNDIIVFEQVEDYETYMSIINKLNNKND